SKMLYLYEHGKVLMSREKLERLERFFNEKLRTPIKGTYSSSNQVATNDNVDNLLLSHKVNLFSLEFYACSSPIDLTNTNGVDIIGIAYSSDRHTDRKLAHVLKEMRDSLDNFIPAFYRPSSKVDSYRQIAVIDSEEVRENPSLISLSKVIKEKCTKL
ncbi:MAG: hypothetical protein N3E37_01160, partial [Candidatus Micrarchaeota archaeon]|nr:hypothetical protein [Candidatus Micrarchaeota archaeon]